MDTLIPIKLTLADGATLVLDFTENQIEQFGEELGVADQYKRLKKRQQRKEYYN